MPKLCLSLYSIEHPYKGILLQSVPVVYPTRIYYNAPNTPSSACQKNHKKNWKVDCRARWRGFRFWLCCMETYVCAQFVDRDFCLWAHMQVLFKERPVHLLNVCTYIIDEAHCNCKLSLLLPVELFSERHIVNTKTIFSVIPSPEHAGMYQTHWSIFTMEDSCIAVSEVLKQDYTAAL